jgi:hypothetical protein
LSSTAHRHCERRLSSFAFDRRPVEAIDIARAAAPATRRKRLVRRGFSPPVWIVLRGPRHRAGPRGQLRRHDRKSDETVLSHIRIPGEAMATYGTWDDGPASEVHVYHSRRLKPARGRGARDDARDWTARRKAQPHDEPLPVTFKWIARLPRRIWPTALLRHFPRIANLVAAYWDHPVAMHAYFDELLVDRRGDRQGFPSAVLTDVLRLRLHYEALHPPGDVMAIKAEHATARRAVLQSTRRAPATR